MFHQYLDLKYGLSIQYTEGKNTKRRKWKEFTVKKDTQLNG